MSKLGQLGSRTAGLLARIPTRRVDYLLALLITAAGLALYSFVNVGGNSRAGFTFLQNIELRSLDMRFQARGKRPVDPRIVIVGLDEKTLRKVGSFPITRNNYARLVDRLSAGGASIIAFDADFPTAEENSAVVALKKLEAESGQQLSPEIMARILEIERSSNHDALFAASVKKAGNVVLGHLFLDASRAGDVDPKAAEDYYNVLWGKPFPQMQKVKGKQDRDFNLTQAWIGNSGFVAQSVEPNLRLLAEAARSYGFFTEEPDLDGTYRRALLLIRYQEFEWYPSLALETWRQYQNIPDQQIVGYMSENGLERLQYGDQTLWPRRDGTMLINYAGPYQTYPQYSMIDVIDGKVPEKTFQGKIVLVGATALGIGDLRNTPFQSHDYMGVEIHANVLDNLLHNGERGRGFLARGDREEMVDIAVILFFGLGLGLLFARVKPLYSTLSVLLALFVFGSTVFFAFARWGMWLSFVVPAGVLVANYAAITSFRMIFEEREKRKIRRTFGAYVSPGVIRLIENNPALLHPGGELKQLTIMFSDIRGFTSVSEGLTPNELVLLLNEFLGAMTEILFQWWGTLDKYIGDAIMAFWGSPYPQEDHAFRACTCALDMSTRLDELNVKWAGEGRKTLNIGVGINTGPVNVGNMGSSQRIAWTVMGDHVNLASRLEGLTKKYHVRVVISEFTYEQVRLAYVTRELDRIMVVGRSQPVAIYQLIDFMKEQDRYAGLLERWEKALAAYKRQEWGKAADQFEAILAAYPGDGPSETLLERSKKFMIHPPAPDWDGVYVMETK
jgi:adenylate cyclase